MSKRIIELMRGTHMPNGLTGVGFTADDVKPMAASSHRQTRAIANAPRLAGLADIENRVLRHVSDAFVEDPVRILRVARFAARFAHWGFRVAHGTNRLMRDMDAWGYSFRLGSSQAWFESDADDARAWLLDRKLLDASGVPAFSLRKG